MELGGKTEQVLLRDYQMHPFRPIVLHIDFQRVDATTKITKKVPLHFINEENSPAVKTDSCIVNHVVTELRIQCLASQLPEFLTDRPGRPDQGPVAARQRHEAAGTASRSMTHGKPNPVIVSVDAAGRCRGRSRRRRWSPPRHRPTEGQEEREAEQEVIATSRGLEPAERGLFIARIRWRLQPCADAAEPRSLTR